MATNTPILFYCDVLKLMMSACFCSFLLIFLRKLVSSLEGLVSISFDHSVDLRGDSGPDTMFVEKSSIRKHAFSYICYLDNSEKRLNTPQPATMMNELFGNYINSTGFKHHLALAQTELSG